MMKPFLPRAVTNAGRGDAPERIQRLLIKEIYARYQVKPAAWEIEGILAVLDPRIRSMGYGRRFLASLPPAPVTYDMEQVRRFFADGAD